MEDLDFESAKPRNRSSLNAAGAPGETEGKKFERKSWAGMGPRISGSISLATGDGRGGAEESDIVKLMVFFF